MPPRQRRQQQQEPRSDAALITAIAGAMVVGASAQATAQTLASVVGIPAPSLLIAILIARSETVTYGIATLPSATAASESQRLEAVYRAQFVLASSRRVHAAKQRGVPEADIRAQEQRYFQQHIDAMKNRRDAATKVDSAARRYGTTLGWYAVLDNRTSKECREAHGRNFDATRRPAIGYPGAVHPHCRCRAGKAHATSKTVYSVKPEERAA